jgi:putative aldouronate transport system permease protein
MNTKTNFRQKFKRLTPFDYFNYAFITLLSAAFLYPMVMTLSLSISDMEQSSRAFTLLPHGFSLDSYKYLLTDGKILRYYFNSIYYAVCGTLLTLVITSMAAYPFIVKEFRGKTFFNLFMIFTMFFSGGLIPSFYVNRTLGLMNNPLVMIIPGAVGAYTVVVYRTFFSGLPVELRESAHIDGAGHFRILFSIIVPLSKPLLATFALMSLVGKWNDYFTAMIYLRSQELQPVQMLLRRLLVVMDFKDVDSRELLMTFQKVTSRSVKCAAVIITIAPIMCVYPFMQRYFTKGFLVGSLKS